MSLWVTDLAISISAVRSICLMTWCTHSNVAFAWGFLTMVGLCFIPYDLHRYLKCSFNSLPLLYIMWQHHVYLHNQVLFNNVAMWSEFLSKILSAVSSSLLLTVCFVVIGWLWVVPQFQTSWKQGQSHEVYLRVTFAFKSVWANEVDTKISKGCLWRS